MQPKRQETRVKVPSLSKNNVSNIVLGHLSKENNFPELAYQTVYNEIDLNGHICNLSVASRDFVDPMITL